MARYVRDVMTQRPVTLQTTDTVIAAARSMRDGNIGDVVVLEEDRIQGILTDRDIVVRAVANDAVGDAEKIMRDRAIRRLPVVEREGPVGIMSLGGLAVEQNPESTLGGISAAPPNGSLGVHAPAPGWRRHDSVAPPRLRMGTPRT